MYCTATILTNFQYLLVSTFCLFKKFQISFMEINGFFFIAIPSLQFFLQPEKRTAWGWVGWQKSHYHLLSPLCTTALRQASGLPGPTSQSFTDHKQIHHSAWYYAGMPCASWKEWKFYHQDLLAQDQRKQPFTVLY